MAVTVRFFAMLRESAGVASVDLDADDLSTAGEAADVAARRFGIHDLVARMCPSLAVNRQYASADTAISDGDEVALIPPVSGGSGPRVHVAVTPEPLSLDRLVAFVREPGAGGIVTFLGEPRDVDRLDYEAYVEMAEEHVRATVAAVAAEHGLCAVAVEHRIGPVPQGEPCVIVAVSAPHRAEAFAAAKDAMDRIKATAPIWKREVRGDAAAWVGAADAERVP